MENTAKTGFSQKCADANSDGICDSAYNIKTNNTDYLPLAELDTTPPTARIITPPNGN